MCRLFPPVGTRDEMEPEMQGILAAEISEQQEKYRGSSICLSYILIPSASGTRQPLPIESFIAVSFPHHSHHTTSGGWDFTYLQDGWTRAAAKGRITVLWTNICAWWELGSSDRQEGKPREIDGKAYEQP